MSKEIIDLTNELDEVVGQRVREELVPGELVNVRTVNGFLINSQGKLWIPKRRDDKKYCPGCLDLSLGGYVQSGEDYDQAFGRELKEELNLETESVAFVRAGKLSPYKVPVSSFTSVYFVYTDEDPLYNRQDFSEASWLTPQELMDRLKNGEPAKSDLQILVDHFFIKDVPEQ